jgi:DNA invertase Pin-like site-specific DNA recombinase
VLYARTSTSEQANGLDAQRERLLAEAKRLGVLGEILEEHASGKTLARRPVLLRALDRLDKHEAEMLLVTKWDRLARSVRDALAIVDRAQRKRWSLVVMEAGLDTGTAVGRMVATNLLAFAEFEREIISERTRESLAVVKAQGKQLGHPSTVPTKVSRRIADLREKGWSWRRITDKFNAEGVPGPAGGSWHPTAVRRVFKRAGSQ